MCRLRHIPHRVWPVDIGPARDVSSSVVVGVQREAALTTAEYRLARPVGFVGVPALRTLATGVARVNVHNADTRKPRFVLNLCSEVVERPGVQRRTLTTPSPYPLAYALQVLKGDSLAVALRGCDDALCNDVVRIVGKAAFSTGKFFQLALSRLRTFALQFRPQTAVTVPNTLDVATAVGAALRVGSYLSYAHINAKVALNIFGRRLRNGAGRQQVELATRVDKVGLAMLKLKPPKLPLARAVKHFLASLERPNRHTELIRLPLEYAVVVGDSAVWPKGALRFAVELVGVSYLALTPYRHLRGKPEPLPNLVVHESVKAELLKGLRVPGHIRDVVARLVCSFQSGKQGSVLFGRGEQLHLGSKPHNDIIPHFQGSEASTAARQKGPDIRPAGYAPPRLERPGYPLRPGLFL